MRSLRPTVFLLFLLLLHVEIANADSLSTSAGTGASVLGGGGLISCTNLSGTTPTSSCNSVLSIAQSGSASGLASASAAYGILRAFAEATAVDLSGAQGFSAGAGASARAQDSFGFGGLTGPAFFSVTQSLSGSSFGITSVYLQTTLSFIGSGGGASQCVVTSTATQTCTLAILPGGGVLFTLDLNVNASAQAWTFRGISYQQSQANFLNTGQVIALQVVDINGNPIPGVTINSSSGTVYPTGQTAVPEPASFVLVSSGLIGLALRKIKP